MKYSVKTFIFSYSLLPLGKKITFFSIFFQGLPIIDDGNSHNFFCALRLVIDSQATDQQKLFPQSARTKCVKPLVSKINKLDAGTAKWNELFIFEVPRKVTCLVTEMLSL